MRYSIFRSLLVTIRFFPKTSCFIASLVSEKLGDQWFIEWRQQSCLQHLKSHLTYYAYNVTSSQNQLWLTSSCSYCSCLPSAQRQLPSHHSPCHCLLWLRRLWHGGSGQTEQCPTLQTQTRLFLSISLRLTDLQRRIHINVTQQNVCLKQQPTSDDMCCSCTVTLLQLSFCFLACDFSWHNANSANKLSWNVTEKRQHPSESAYCNTMQNTLTAVKAGGTCARHNSLAASTLSVTHASCIWPIVCMPGKSDQCQHTATRLFALQSCKLCHCIIASPDKKKWYAANDASSLPSAFPAPPNSSWAALVKPSAFTADHQISYWQHDNTKPQLDGKIYILITQRCICRNPVLPEWHSYKSRQW